MKTEQFNGILKDYLLNQIDKISASNPIISFMKPLATRALDKNLDKFGKALDLISDKDGNLDAVGILSEMIDNISTTQPFTLDTSYIGEIEIGGGEIKFNLPLTSKKLVLDTNDLNAFKDLLISKINQYG